MLLLTHHTQALWIYQNRLLAYMLSSARLHPPSNKTQLLYICINVSW